VECHIACGVTDTGRSDMTPVPHPNAPRTRSFVGSIWPMLSPDADFETKGQVRPPLACACFD